MQKRIVHSRQELYDDSSPIIFEKTSKEISKKSLKQFIDTSRGRGKYINGDPESKGKSEVKIEKELEAFFNTISDCAWWNTKVKGEIQSTSKGNAIIKESKNRGFGDYLLCIRGIFLMVEAKACGRYQSPWQIDQQEKVQKKGRGFYFIVTSVREIIILMTACGILKK